MIQLLALLAISWLLLWFFEKQDLSVLGLVPTKNRITYFIILFIVSACAAALAFGLKMYFVKEAYSIAPALTFKSVLQESWFQFRSVLTEELLCRGALLYILIKKTGKRKAIFISAILFAVLHWLNAGVWGNAMQMIIVFAFTFAMGLLLAYAYTKTFSLLIPLAIHYGWNLTQNYIFPESAAGNHIFILTAPPPSVTISYLAFFTMLLLPKISLLLCDYFIVKHHKQIEMP
jgi:uncharacterized protein